MAAGAESSWIETGDRKTKRRKSIKKIDNLAKAAGSRWM